MKQAIIHDPSIVLYNKVVKATYFQIHKYAKTMLSKLERDELRCTLIREDKSIEIGPVIHEMINPLLYLRLEQKSNGYYSIHYGFERWLTVDSYCQLASAFTRYIYKVSMSTTTTINIEDAVQVDRMIVECSDLYEQIEDRQRFHHFEKIPYKPAATKRKQMQAVA